MRMEVSLELFVGAADRQFYRSRVRLVYNTSSSSCGWGLVRAHLHCVKRTVGTASRHAACPRHYDMGCGRGSRPGAAQEPAFAPLQRRQLAATQRAQLTSHIYLCHSYILLCTFRLDGSPFRHGMRYLEGRSIVISTNYFL